MKSKDSKNPEDWFRKANGDLAFAKAGFKESGVPSVACFLSQQVAEKYLKGFLLSRNKEFKKTHNLMELAKKCALLDKNFEKIVENLKILNKYYKLTRYPDGIFIDYTVEDATEALELAEKITLFIKKLN